MGNESRERATRCVHHDEEPSLSRLAALLVRAGSVRCALPVELVIETMRPLPCEPVSGAPAHVRGLSLVRGAPTPVVDLGRLLGVEDAAAPARFVLLGPAGRAVALAVEEVVGLRSIEGLRALPLMLGEVPSSRVDAMAAVNDELTLVLAAARILTDAQWSALVSGST